MQSYNMIWCVTTGTSLIEEGLWNIYAVVYECINNKLITRILYFSTIMHSLIMAGSGFAYGTNTGIWFAR